jgi:hypothetical protein
MKCLNFLKEESICVFNEYLEINLNPYFHRRKASHKEWNTEPLWWKISLREEWVRTMIINCWTPVAHARNPSYSGGRDQDLKKTITKKDWWSDSRCRPWVQTPVAPKKNKNAGELMLGMQQKLASFSVSCKHPLALCHECQCPFLIEWEVFILVSMKRHVDRSHAPPTGQLNLGELNAHSHFLLTCHAEFCELEFLLQSEPRRAAPRLSLLLWTGRGLMPG